MRHEIFHLKDFYRELGKNGCDATLTTYLPDNLPEMGRIDERRPCLLICPGGGYEFCSKREQEPIALYFLPNGFNVFILKYSAAPNRYPTQLREVAAAMELIYKKRTHGTVIRSVSRLWVSPQVGIWQRIIPTSTVARKFGRCFRTASLFRHQYFATRLLQLIQRGRILAALTRFWGKRIALQKKLWISPATNLLPEVRRPLFYGIRPKIHAFLL